MQKIQAITRGIFVFFMVVLPSTFGAMAAERAQIERFLTVTGFDVALESLRITARSAPDMLGLDARDFGFQWQQMVDEIFEVSILHERAIEMLSETLEEPALTHAIAFYASDLGKRLVQIENRAHMSEDDSLKDESGAEILEGLIRIGSPRVETLKRLNAASDAWGHSVRAIQEVQIRFLMAAAAAGVIELTMDEADMRALFQAEEAELQQVLRAGALAASAYTYQAFSDDEVAEYAAALEHETMQLVYELMNVVQFEVMAERYEILAAAMSNLQPSEDL